MHGALTFLCRGCRHGTEFRENENQYHLGACSSAVVVTRGEVMQEPEAWWELFSKILQKVGTSMQRAVRALQGKTTEGVVPR
ncbi:hypothetical protein VULLAG_LOCUS8129 [Vulpes lagopus]